MVENHAGTPHKEVRKDRHRRWLLFLGVIIFLASSLTAASFGVDAVQSQQHDHLATVKLQTEIIAKDKQTITLLKEHSASFAAQKKAATAQAKYDADVKILAQELVEQQAAICTATHAACPPLQKLP